MSSSLSWISLLSLTHSLTHSLTFSLLRSLFLFDIETNLTPWLLIYSQALNMSPPLEQWNLISSMELDELIPIDSLDTHCIGGIGQRTLSSAIIDGELTRDSKWTPVYTDGDEYVITKSMRECKKLDGKEGKFTFKEFNLDHMQLIKEKSAIDYIISIINSLNGKKKKKQQ